VVLAGLPASVEVDRARLEFAQLLLEDLRRVDQQRRDTRRRLATMVADIEDPAERHLRRRADHRR
jgi:class 3 adenylate cyclase